MCVMRVHHLKPGEGLHPRNLGLAGPADAESRAVSGTLGAVVQFLSSIRPEMIMSETYMGARSNYGTLGQSAAQNGPLT